MSEFKEKVLSEISFAMVDDAPDLQKLYEKVATIDEQQQLNDNQKIVFEWLQETWKSHRRNDWTFPFSLLKNAVMEMPSEIYDFYDDFTEKEEFELLIAFAEWGLKQEESSNEI